MFAFYNQRLVWSPLQEKSLLWKPEFMTILNVSANLPSVVDGDRQPKLMINTERNKGE
ncbi:MAG: hypothetical protein ACI9IP_002177 [Arcticibacterium sp.]|jgi:hypothetical protein